MEVASFPFKLGQTVESRYNTDGYRGAWFKSEIVKISSRKGGELWCALKYPDYPDEKVTWTKAYQFSPLLNKESRQKNKELMLRPAFPPVVRRCIYDQNLYAGLTIAIVDDEWKVGDLVDWWADDCFWECQITEMLDQGNVKVELPKRPFGEGIGSSYSIASGNLRPSLKWCPQYGWTVPSKVSPHQRSCVSLVSVQAEQSSEGKIDPDLSIELYLADEKPFEGDEIVGSSYMTESGSDNEVLGKGKSRLQKMGRVSKCPEADSSSSCNGESNEEQIDYHDWKRDIHMGFIDTNPLDCEKEIVSPKESTINLQTKLSLSRKIIRNAKHGFWARRYAASTPCRAALQRELDHCQGGSKPHVESVDTMLENTVVNSVPFSVATPPLFNEWRERSSEASSCNRTAQSCGISDTDPDENNVKTPLVRTVGNEAVDGETCEEKQIGCKLVADGEHNISVGVACPSEVRKSENLEMPLSFAADVLPFTTVIWEDPRDSQKEYQTEYQNSLQKENSQPQPCILALPAFNGLKGHERTNLCKRMVRPLQKWRDISESHAQSRKKSPLHWQQSQINTNCFPSRKKFPYASASRSKCKNLLSKYSLEGRDLQSLNRKTAVRHEVSGQGKHVKATSCKKMVYEEAEYEEMVTTLLDLEEISEKVIFMRDCLQLGMRRLFQKQDKSVWSATINIEGTKEPQIPIIEVT